MKIGKLSLNKYNERKKKNIRSLYKKLFNIEKKLKRFGLKINKKIKALLSINPYHLYKTMAIFLLEPNLEEYQIKISDIKLNNFTKTKEKLYQRTIFRTLIKLYYQIFRRKVTT